MFNAGGTGVSRDDLLMDSGQENMFYTPVQRKQSKGKPATKILVAIEEKVDGANLGISLGENMEIRVQNRSHFVNSQTHRQFSTLDSWLSEHSGELYDLLDSGNNVLFGEWLYAKHSIHYTRLPGYFMAFDLYSLKEKKFYSWRERNRRLEDTTIPVVRQIAETTLSGRDDVSFGVVVCAHDIYLVAAIYTKPPTQVRKWLDTPSEFYDGPCEGIYLRVDEDANAPEGVVVGGPYCKYRGKLVRSDFLQGIEEQWTRQQLTKNIVRY